MKDRWIEPMVKKWKSGIKYLSKVVVRYPQTAYDGFTQSLQAEWQYLCRCMPGVEKHLGPVEDAIHRHFIPALLEVNCNEASEEFRQLLLNS